MQLELARDGRDCSSPHLESDSPRGSGLAIEAVSGVVDMDEGVGLTTESVTDALATGGASGESVAFAPEQEHNTVWE
jgi:hypothetical protein